MASRGRRRFMVRSGCGDVRYKSVSRIAQAFRVEIAESDRKTVHPSAGLRARRLLSDIVKRKHIRSKGRIRSGLRDAARRSRETVLFVSGPLEHLSRGPRLTARLPDVFEAKLVFSNRRDAEDGGRRKA